MTTINTPRFIIALLSLFAVGLTAHAQMDAGFIGKRYAGLSFFNEKVQSSNIDNGTGVELSANIPIIDSLDAGLRLSSERFSTYSITDRRITGSVIGYADVDWAKPFAELSATSTDQSSTFNGIKYRNRETLWGVAIGLEVPFSRSTALTATVTRNEYFNSSFDAYWTYKVGINTWITPKVGFNGAITIWDGESTTFSAGLCIRF